MVGWGGSCRGGVGHVGFRVGWVIVGWVIKGWASVGNAGLGCVM